MKKEEKQKAIELVKKKAAEAEIRDDLCARSTMYGLSCYFDFISGDIVRATFNLAGGVGASSGTCGAFSSGQLAIGLKYAPSMEEVDTEEGKKKMEVAEMKMIEFREVFLKEFGTTLCPEIHKKIYGRSFDFKNQKEAEEFFSIPDHAEKCASIVEKGAALAAEFILNDE